MITRETTICYRADGTSREKNTFWGKSTDEKPLLGVENADIFYEMDTYKVFLFDEETKTWMQQ